MQTMPSAPSSCRRRNVSSNAPTDGRGGLGEHRRRLELAPERRRCSAPCGRRTRASPKRIVSGTTSMPSSSQIAGGRSQALSVTMRTAMGPPRVASPVASGPMLGSRPMVTRRAALARAPSDHARATARSSSDRSSGEDAERTRARPRRRRRRPPATSAGRRRVAPDRAGERRGDDAERGGADERRAPRSRPTARSAGCRRSGGAAARARRPRRRCTRRSTRARDPARRVTGTARARARR